MSTTTNIPIGTSSSDTDVAGIVSYVYNGTPYATLGLLNAALALPTDSVPAGGSITIDVVYDELLDNVTIVTIGVQPDDEIVRQIVAHVGFQNTRHRSERGIVDFAHAVSPSSLSG